MLALEYSTLPLLFFPPEPNPRLPVRVSGGADHGTHDDVGRDVRGQDLDPHNHCLRHGPHGLPLLRPGQGLGLSFW